MKQDKQMLAFVNKMQKKSKVIYDAKQAEQSKIPECDSCLSKDKECSSCIKDKTSPGCKFKPVSQSAKRLATYAMLGSLMMRNTK